MQQAIQNLAAQGFDVSKFTLTGNPDVDLRAALAVTGHLDDYEKQSTWESNVSADNTRQDRNTDSMIEDRRTRQAETRRHHDQTDRTRRRAQDNRPTPRAAAPITATGPNGEKAQYLNGKWVPMR